jgi:hypothetical protein
MAQEKKGSVADLLRHPLASVVIGFLLTGVLGTTLAQYYIVQRDKQTKQHELAATRKESITQLSARNAEYLARAKMFLAAVDRGDPGGAKELKGTFDDAALRWRTEISPTLMAARDVLPPQVYVQFRERISKVFDDQFLVPFGRCLEAARQTLADGGDAATVLADCRARAYLTQAATCSQALLDMLYELSGYTVAGRVEEALRVNREIYQSALAAACATND